MSKLVDEFRDRLLSTKREGMADLLDYMADCGFLEAPCSGGHHLAKEGGLLEHSINVLHLAEKISVALIGGKNLTKQMKDSIIISALLHDLGKMGQFEKPNYIPNVLKSGEISKAKPFVTNPDLIPIDHEIRSIAIASMFIDLTEDEQFAILCHNGMYGNLKYMLQGKETPLYMIIHWADMWASRVTEAETKEKGEDKNE
jgi:23S rRNA maturation-related 3'-5' exoribonuclease YhaM